MNFRLNRLLLYIIIVLIGVFCLIQSFLNLVSGSLFIFCLSIAFLLLYKTKGKRWSLVLGLYLLFVGLSSFLGHSMFTSIFFFVPAFISLILYRERRKKKFLVISMILFFIGISILI